MPLPLQLVQTHLLNDLDRTQVRNVHLVGKHQHWAVSHRVVVDHVLHGLAGLVQSFLVGRVHDVDEGVCAFEVMVPKVDDLALCPDIPDCELQSLVVDFFDVEPDGGH